MTEEQREKRKASQRRYVEKNKEKLRVKAKAYYEVNKEKRKAYYEANKEEIAAKQKAYEESKKTPYTVVYLLPKENYIGVTNRLELRLKDHRSTYKRDTSDYRIIGKYDTKKEALALERMMHAYGYKGGR